MDQKNSKNSVIEAKRPDIDTGISQIKKIKYQFGILGFVVGALLAGVTTYLITGNNSSKQFANQEDVPANHQEANLDEQEQFENELEEGTIQDEASDRLAKEMSVELPQHVSGQFGEEVTIDEHSITIHKVERGITFNPGQTGEKFDEGWIRVYFTIKNLSEMNVKYSFEDFTLEAGNGEVENSQVDLGMGVGEFAFATLIPDGSKKGFVVFETDSDSGTLVWSPPNSDGSARITFEEI